MTFSIIIKFNIDTAFSNLSKLPIIAKKSAKFILLFPKKRTAMNLISAILRSNSSAFLYISLPSLHDYKVKLPNSRFVEEGNQRQQISLDFPEL